MKSEDLKILWEEQERVSNFFFSFIFLGLASMSLLECEEESFTEFTQMRS